MKPLANQPSIYDTIFLFPTALGDSLMTVIALKKAVDFLKNKKILIVVNSNYISIFHLTFPKYSIIDYFNLADLEKHYETSNLVDFRSDSESQKVRSFINSKTCCYFNFDFGRKITIQTLGSISTFDAVEIDDRVDAQKNNNFAWYMDAELLSYFLEITFSELIYKKNKRFTTKKYDGDYSNVSQVLCFPCGENSQKHWPVDYWLNFITLLIDQGYKPLVFLGPSEKEYLEIFSEHVETYYSYDLVYIIKNFFQNSVVVANDCGPMHLAGLFGKPLIAIFGPTNEKVWFPYESSTALALRGKTSKWPLESYIFEKFLTVVDTLRKTTDHSL